MTDLKSIGELIALYKKHGWILRRIVLSPPSKEKHGASLRINYPGIPVIDSDLDAGWFSRPPMAGAIAWEIRYLGDLPFALVESLDEKDSDFEMILRDAEKRLAASIAQKRLA